MKRSLLIILLLIVLSTVIFIFSKENASGWFTTGQAAYILLSGIDFNNTGGALLFNHPMNIATDGQRLLLADARNNRVLIWNTIPEGNVEPDLVLGQSNFTTNNPGTGKNGLNWPAGVAIADGKVVIADTFNDRILIWNSFPNSNGQEADFSIEFDNQADPKENLRWPWDVWTDGSKLIVTSTEAASVLIYNTFPSNNDQKADLYLKAKNSNDGTDRFGTPRTIGTDGESYLVIGDHNAKNESSEMGNFFWNSFPTTDNAPYDFFMENPVDPKALMWGGIKSSDGKFIAVAQYGIAIWNSVPTSAVAPDLIVGRSGREPCNETGYFFMTGDGSDLVLTPSGKFFISLYNANKIVAFNSLPTSSTQCPDYAIGGPDIDTNTLDTNYIITNGVPSTNGSSLFVSSDFDKKLYVWRSIPTESGTHPDIVYELDFAPWDNALHNDIFIMAGLQEIQIWTNGLPLYGNTADITFDKNIGSISFQDIRGVALDDLYLYILDEGAGKLYVWSALPDSNASPLFSLDLEGASRLSSDGNYLAVVFTDDKKVQIYNVASLSGSSLPLVEITQISNEPGQTSFNLPRNVLITENHLFIADTHFSRVFCWESITNAINGNFPDVIIGKSDYVDVEPRIGQDSLFWPGGIALHRNKLWIGEFKFGGRLLCFKYQPEGPFIEASPTYGDFGDLEIGSSQTKTFTITNTGTADLKIETTDIEVADVSDFSTKNNSCTGKTLVPSGTCTLDVTFSPTSVGTSKANLTISSNDPNLPKIEIPLYGEGVSAQLPPSVTTDSASSVTSNSATLNAKVNPNGASTEYYFEYGASTSYGSKTEAKDAGTGTGEVSVSANISNLSASTTYHFRITSANNAGTSHGDDKTFTTSSSGGDTEGGEEGGGGCAIATACYGTLMAEEVKTLRAFRDQYLITSLAGRNFLKIYYRFSPKIADFIRDKEHVKTILRGCLKPIIWVAGQVVK